MAQFFNLLNPADVEAKPANVEELKVEISKLRQRLDNLERVQKDPVFMVEDYGPKSHALFEVSPKLAKELLYYNLIRQRALFSFHSGLKFGGTTTPGWVIMEKGAYKEVTEFLTSLGVVFVLQDSSRANGSKPTPMSSTSFPPAWTSSPAPRTVPQGWLTPAGTPPPSLLG